MGSIAAEGYQMTRFLFWAPRILAIFHALWMSAIAIFLLKGFPMLQTMSTVLRVIIPPAIIVVFIVISWRRDLVGAVAFAAAALFYAFKVGRSLDWMSMFAGPLFLIAVLFLANWLHRRKLRSSF